MADLQKGHTFATGQEVTADSLNNLVDNGSVLNITSADVKTDHRLPQLNNIVPSSGVGDLWFDTGAAFGAQGGEFKARSGGVWHSAALNAETVFSYTGTPLAGEVVVLDTTADNTVVRTTTAADTGVVGVVVQSPENNKVRVCRDGYAQVKVGNDPVPARGDYITSSTTEGEAVAVPSMTDGVFGRLVQVDPSDSTIWYALIFPVKAYTPSTSILASVSAASGETASGLVQPDAGVLNNAFHVWTTLQYTQSTSGSITFSTTAALNAGELVCVSASNAAVKPYQSFTASDLTRIDGWRVIATATGFEWSETLSTRYAEVSGSNANEELNMIQNSNGSGIEVYGESSGTAGAGRCSGLILKNIAGTFLAPIAATYTFALQFSGQNESTSTMSITNGSDDVYIRGGTVSTTLTSRSYGIEPTLQVIKR